MPAKVTVCLSPLSNRAATGATIQAPPAAVRADQVDITTSATSQATTIVAQANEIWVVTVKGGDVRMAADVDEQPVALNNRGTKLLDGSTRPFTAEAGQKLAFIDAAA